MVMSTSAFVVVMFMSASTFMIMVFMSASAFMVMMMFMSVSAAATSAMDTTYISVLWRGNRILNKEHAVREIIEMCRKNEFENIKLSEHLEETVEDYYITIYKNEQQLQAGNVWLVVKYNRKENIMKIL